jgi:hypothetical protein
LLELIDEGLEAFFRASVPLSATDIDMSFEAPDREWSAKLNRPTVNAFLWDIRRSSSRSRSGVRTVERDGARVHEPAMPVVELRYVVTAWTSDHGDERALLSGLMRPLLRYGQIPRDYLSDAFDALQAPQLVMARVGEEHLDVMKALEGQVKPVINMVVITEFDIGAGVPAGPPVDSIETSIAQIGAPAEERPRHRRVAGEVLDPSAVGALVRSSIDATKVNSSGRFLIRAEPGDEITLDVEPPMSVTVPETGGIRFGSGT